MDYPKWFKLLVIFSSTILAASTAAAESEPSCSPWAARLESAEGEVLWRNHTRDTWRRATPQDRFCHGDMLKVLDGRAALRLANDTLVRLNASSVIRLMPPERPFWLELVEGAALFLSRTSQKFTVKAPYLNAAVDGTEFLVSTAPSETRVAVFEGRVSARNDAGNVALGAGEQTLSTSSGAPQPVAKVTLQGAASWGLYYPPVAVNADTPEPIKMAIAQGSFGQALDAIASSPPHAMHSDLAALGASLALAQGQVELAQSFLRRALSQDSAHTQSLAIDVLITLIQGDAASAHQRALGLAEGNPHDATLLMVLSYTTQSQERLSDALAAAERALALAPDNEFIIARATELTMAVGNNRKALQMIERALALGHQSAKTHALAGFVELNHYATAKAIRHFTRAIDKNAADPLAFLGMGLAKIQNGELERGRQYIELAVLLDPANSLLRSYLGKSYYEERRHSLADTQYQLAKTLDPDDPTPWFYEAHLKQTQNKLPEAVRLIETAISKNDNRAVYRSRLMLDSDAAARSADQSRIYQNIGFDALAIDTAANAVAKAPADYAGHRALATALATEPRYQEAKASEALQATILQPLGARTLGPSFSENRLKLLPSAGPHRLGINEYTPLFAQKGAQGHISALAGNDDLRALDWQARLLGARTALTVGQYHHQEAVHVAGRTADYRVTEALAQFQPTTQLQLQAQLSQRDDSEENGSVEEPEGSDTTSTDRSVRARLEPSQGHTLLLDFTDRSIDDATHVGATWPDGTAFKYYADSLIEQKKLELLYILNLDSGWAKVGALDYDSKAKFNDEFLFEPDHFGSSGSEKSHLKQAFRKYSIEHYRSFLKDKLGVTLGLARLVGEGLPLREEETVSAVALQWQIDNHFTIHSGYWQDVVQPNLAYLESTALSVFQRRDDNDSWVYVETSALNVRFTSAQLRAAVELRSTNSLSPASVTLSDRRFSNRFDEYSAEAYINWSHKNKLAVALSYGWEMGKDSSLNNNDSVNDPGVLRTVEVPLTISYFPGTSWYFRADLSRVTQASRSERQGVERKTFTNLDLTSSWHAQKRPLSVSMSLLNILGDNTRYLSGGISTYGETLETGFNHFAEEPTAVLRITLSM